ncbi:aminotransferase class III-fold pyridoxal phosphate-dependent enzyme [Amycolatopsis pigmentata]|uniref:Aminotransferase class III-fold pyridoxal phosphate-dependent enzyme n=1 Tax=Amycolatopsis pigmentata TaxID=450801 RepID=A0ABW5FZ10_9PSEU
MSDTSLVAPPSLTTDALLRSRAEAVVPGGMYGHLALPTLTGIPQYIERANGSRLWDVDGNEYVDLMCGWGPVILGYRDAVVEAAAEAQRAKGDCLNGPSPVMIELAEIFVATVEHADWAMFAKNGTDATTMCCTIARAKTGRKKILVAEGAYHGAAPWATPNPTGVPAEDRANRIPYVYNDIESVRAAVTDHADEIAAILACPFRHYAGLEQPLVDEDFARDLRDICDEIGAALILDDVRAGFRMHHGSSWEPIGVLPDLSAWCKAVANGYPISAVTGNDDYRDAAASIFVTGSFWMSAVPMAAAVATITELGKRDAVGRMAVVGEQLRAGIRASAERYGFAVSSTGPVQIPTLLFTNDTKYQLAKALSYEALARGVYTHPARNWFISAAMTDADLDMALTGLDGAFQAVRKAYPDAS